MPYIAAEDRPALDGPIEELARAIGSEGYEGRLNYAITRLCLEVMPELRYKQLNTKHERDGHQSEKRRSMHRHPVSRTTYI